MREVLVTGATGLIGGEIVLQLVRQGCERVWCLTRGANEAQARQRLRRRLLLPRAYGPQVAPEELDLDNKVIALHGDFTHPNLRLPSDVARRVQGGLTALVHCAAELSF